MFVAGFQIHLSNVDMLTILAHHCADSELSFAKFMKMYRVSVSSLHLWGKAQQKIILVFGLALLCLFASHVVLIIAAWPIFMKEAGFDPNSPRLSAYNAYREIYSANMVILGSVSLTVLGILYQIAKISNRYNDLLLFLAKIHVEDGFSDHIDELLLIHERRGAFSLFGIPLKNTEVMFMAKLIFIQVLVFAIAMGWDQT